MPITIIRENEKTADAIQQALSMASTDRNVRVFDTADSEGSFVRLRCKRINFGQVLLPICIVGLLSARTRMWSVSGSLLSSLMIYRKEDAARHIYNNMLEGSRTYDGSGNLAIVYTMAIYWNYNKQLYFIARNTLSTREYHTLQNTVAAESALCGVQYSVVK